MQGSQILSKLKKELKKEMGYEGVEKLGRNFYEVCEANLPTKRTFLKSGTVGRNRNGEDQEHQLF